MINVTDISKANEALEEVSNVIFFHSREPGELELKGYPCVVTKASMLYRPGYWAFTFPKNSPYRKLFSHFLLAMRQSGQIQRLYEKHITRIKTLKEEHEKCKKQPKAFFQTCRPNEPNCAPAINLKLVITALVIFIGGSIFSILIMIIERMEYKKQLSRSNNFKNNIPSQYSMVKHSIVIVSSISLFFLVIIVLALLGHIPLDNIMITMNISCT